MKKIAILSFLCAFSLISFRAWSEGSVDKKVIRGIPTSFSLAAKSLSETKETYTQEDLPSVLASGFNQYQSKDATAAIIEWFRGGPSETDATAIQSLLKAFNQMELLYGKYRGYEVMQILDLSATARQVVIQINYDKGPLFIRFLCYNADTGWVVSGRIVFATDPEKIFTPS